MADSEDEITPANSTVVEMYRAALARPEDIPSMRFWVQNELQRIQKGFRSADERIRNISTGEGGEGAEGPAGVPGEPGVDGRGIAVFQQVQQPNDTESAPGDVWFVMRWT